MLTKKTLFANNKRYRHDTRRVTQCLRSGRFGAIRDWLYYIIQLYVSVQRSPVAIRTLVSCFLNLYPNALLRLNPSCLNKFSLYVFPTKILHVPPLSPLHVTYPQSVTLTVWQYVSQSAGLHTARYCRNPDSSIKCSLADSSVLTWKFFTSTSRRFCRPRQHFIEFCRHARFKTYIMKKCACFDRVKYNHHQAACFGSACRRKTQL